MTEKIDIKKTYNEYIYQGAINYFKQVDDLKNFTRINLAKLKDAVDNNKNEAIIFRSTILLLLKGLLIEEIKNMTIEERVTFIYLFC